MFPTVYKRTKLSPTVNIARYSRRQERGKKSFVHVQHELRGDEEQVHREVPSLNDLRNRVINDIAEGLPDAGS